MSLTAEQIAAGWRNKGTLPRDGERVEVLGDDFMGEWIVPATFKLVPAQKKNRQPRRKWVGEGWMGPRKRILDDSDVEAWRPLEQPPSKKGGE